MIKLILTLFLCISVFLSHVHARPTPTTSAQYTDYAEFAQCKSLNLGMYDREDTAEMVEYDGTKCLLGDELYELSVPDIYDYRKEVIWKNLSTGRTWWVKDVVVDYHGINRWCNKSKGFRPATSQDLTDDAYIGVFSEVFQIEKRSASRNYGVGFWMINTPWKNTAHVFVPRGIGGAHVNVKQSERSYSDSDFSIAVIPICIRD